MSTKVERNPILFIIATTVYLLLSGIPASGQPFELRKMLDTTSPVPGGQISEVFTGFEDFSLEAGNLYFVGVGSLGTEGVYQRAIGDVTVVADTSFGVPNGLPNETFEDFTESNFPGFGRPFAIDGSVFFWARGDMGSEGIYKSTDGSLEVVVDKNTSVPGAGASFSTFEGGFGASRAGVVFIAQLSPSMDRGIYLVSATGVVEVANTSNTVVPNGAAGELFSGFFDVAVSDDWVYFRAVGTQETFGIYRVATDRFDSIEVVIDAETPSPDGGGFFNIASVFSQVGISPVHGLVLKGDAGDRPTLGPILQGKTDNSRGIFRELPTLSTVASSLFTDVPGHPGITLESFFEPAADRTIAFKAEVNLITNSGIYVKDGNRLQTVADLETSVPGEPGNTFTYFFSKLDVYDTVFQTIVVFVARDSEGDLAMFRATSPVRDAHFAIDVPTLDAFGLLVISLCLAAAGIASLPEKRNHHSSRRTW